MNTPSAPDDKAELSFEDALARLERTVAEMESGNLSLEQSMARFEEGMRLSRLCAEKLNAAEKRIEMLVRRATGELDWEAVNLTPKPDPGKADDPPH